MHHDSWLRALYTLGEPTIEVSKGVLVLNEELSTKRCKLRQQQSRPTLNTQVLILSVLIEPRHDTVEAVKDLLLGHSFDRRVHGQEHDVVGLPRHCA
jgi:hypothetical protein